VAEEVLGGLEVGAGRDDVVEEAEREGRRIGEGLVQLVETGEAAGGGAEEARMGRARALALEEEFTDVEAAGGAVLPLT
jgi:hypothetical protein